MPLIGHALVGWATAIEVAPPGSGPGRPSLRHLWIPAVIAIAYLPDIAGQIGLLVGWRAGPRFGHSLLFVLVACPLAAIALARIASVSYLRGLAVAGASVLLHDLLDIAQSADRQPWWPFSSRPIVVDPPVIPDDPLRELIAFAALFGALMAIRWLRGRPLGMEAIGGRWRWMGRGLTLVLIALAVATHVLRDRREKQLEAARRRIESRDYRRGLDTLEEAARWPSIAKPGRVDYLRAEAFVGRNARSQAEEHYLRSFEADPGYFGVLADLAAFYADEPQPLEIRRARVQPFLDRMRSDHRGNPALPRTLQRIERALERSRPAP